MNQNFLFDKPKSGFTLIELLAVIAIIGTLAAILFPVFAQAKLAAKQAASMSNLRQIGLAALMYANDNDDVFPLTERGGDQGDSHEYYWGDMIEPYAKNWQLLAAPDEAPLQFKPAPSPFSQQWSYSYGINDVTANSPACTPNGSGDGPDSTDCEHVGAAGRSTTGISRPSEIIFVADSLPEAGDNGDVSTSILPSNNPDDLAHSRHEINWQVGHRNNAYLQVDGQSQDGYPRYFGGFTFVACDGHARFRKRDIRVRGAYTGGTQDSEWTALPL